MAATSNVGLSTSLMRALMLLQVLIYKALGFEQPTFGHVSLILAADKSKLSKRWAAVMLVRAKCLSSR